MSTTTVNIGFSHVSWPNARDNGWGRGEAPTVDETKAKMKGVLRAFDAACRKFSVTMADWETEYCDEMNDVWENMLCGKVTGTPANLMALAKAGHDHGEDWYLLIGGEHGNEFTVGEGENGWDPKANPIEESLADRLLGKHS